MAFNFNLGAAAKPAGAPAFGAAPAASQPGAFGGFGAPAASTAATTPSTLFGGGAQPQQPGAAAGGFGGFGATSQAQQPAPAASAFGGFGATSQAAQQQPAATAGGASFGGFGAPAASTGVGAAGNSFAFGGAAASKPAGLTVTPAFGGAGFGAAAGVSTAAKPAGFGGFGATTGGFGATTTTNLGFGMSQQQQQQQAPVLTVPAGYPQQPLPTTPESVLQSLKEAWDPSSPTCQFKHYFYNVVHPSDVNKYAPGPLDDATLYSHAARNNPDPSTLVPALAIGFPALERRAKAQDQHFMNMRVRLAEIAVTLDKLQVRHAAENVAEMAEVRRKLAASAMRVLSMMVQLHVLLNQGTPLRPDEANVRAAIDAAAATLAARGSADGAAGDELPLMARLQALWRQVEQVPDGRVEGGKHGQVSGGLTLADEQQVVQVLANQDKGIAYIVDVVGKDKKEMDRIERALVTDMERVGPSGAATGDGPSFKRSRMYY